MASNDAAAIKLMDKLVNRITKNLSEKGKQYARDEDRFFNFNQIGQMKNIHPLAVLKILQAKSELDTERFISEPEFRETIEKDKLQEFILEKWGDFITYEVLKAGYAYLATLNEYDKMDGDNNPAQYNEPIKDS
mgnify:CR=1 FL=1